VTEFPFERRQSRRFGEVLVPFVPIRVVGPKRALLLSMCVDSGADLSVLPFFVGRTLGFQPNPGNRGECRGIGQGKLLYTLVTATIEVGGAKAECRMAWSLSDDVPAILGRLDVFRQLAIEFREFDNRILIRLPGE
jgi:hypothetical protein